MRVADELEAWCGECSEQNSVVAKASVQPGWMRQIRSGARGVEMSDSTNVLDPVLDSCPDEPKALLS